MSKAAYVDIDAVAREAAAETPEFPMNVAASMFGGFARQERDPRLDDPDWLPDEAEIGVPLNWRLLVLPYRKQTKSMIIDTSAVQKMEDLSCYCGRIISVGARAQDKDSMSDDKVELQRGMYVIYKKYAWTKIKWRGIELAVLNDDHIDLVVADPEDWTFYL